jgi:ATP-dependent Clp protease adapter protein ClpS
MTVGPRSDVLILNDTDTPMAFVVTVLERFFGMSELEALTHMGRIHEEVRRSAAPIGTTSPRKR